MQNRLHKAAADPKGFPEVKRLIEEEKVDVNLLHTESQLPAFDFAMKTGSVETVEYLHIEAKANLDARNKLYNSLYIAFTARQYHVDDKVLAYLQTHINEMVEKFNDGTTGTHVIALCGTLSDLENHVAKNNKDIKTQDIHGRTPFYYALKIGAAEKIRFLITYPNHTLEFDDKTILESTRLQFDKIPNKNVDDTMCVADILCDMGVTYAHLKLFKESLSLFLEARNHYVEILSITNHGLTQFLHLSKKMAQEKLKICQFNIQQVAPMYTGKNFLNLATNNANSLLFSSRKRDIKQNNNNSFLRTQVDASIRARINKKF